MMTSLIPRLLFYTALKLRRRQLATSTAPAGTRNSGLYRVIELVLAGGFAAGKPQEKNCPSERRGDPCAGVLRKRAWESLIKRLRAAVLNVWPMHVIFMKQNIVQLAHINHFAALPATVEVFFLCVV
jgi:hypothetical protein